MKSFYSRFSSRHNPHVAIPRSKTNYFTNSPVSRLPKVSSQIKNFDYFFFFDSCTPLKSCIY